LAEAKPDILLGEEGWFGAGAAPNRLDYELDLPAAWSDAGWKRQRLQPALSGLLFPAAWSLMLLFAGSLPMIIKPWPAAPPAYLMAMWMATLPLLWAGGLRAASAQVEGSPGKMLAWLVLRIDTVVWILIVLVGEASAGDGVVLAALALALLVWTIQMVRIATLLAWPASRMLLPIAHVDIGLDKLESAGWQVSSRRWARRPLARRRLQVDVTGAAAIDVVLFGVRIEGVDFLAVHAVHPSGRILDPFVTSPAGADNPFPSLGPVVSDVPADLVLAVELRKPPLTPVASPWPESMDISSSHDESE
jgi:hypothetical protein